MTNFCNTHRMGFIKECSECKLEAERASRKPSQPISDFALFGKPGSYMQAQREAARRKFEADYDRAADNAED